MSAPAKILIADDHPATRTGVRRVLEADGFVVCAEAATAGEAVKRAVAERPDVCLLDVHMPGGGVQAAREIAERVPDALIVMLTVSRDDDDLFDALRAGAVGYLLKDIERAQLPGALRGVLSGEAAMPPTLVARLIGQFQNHQKQRRRVLRSRPGVQLRRREWEVLELLRDGLTTAEIAQRLFIADVTVRSHVSSILRALHVSSREDAVRLLDGR
jgi:DNA-binding NarL/FixJ family response regulator